MTATKPATVSIVCPCGLSSRYPAAGSDHVMFFVNRGWNYVRRATGKNKEEAGFDYEGVCDECRDLMDEDE